MIGKLMSDEKPDLCKNGKMDVRGLLIFRCVVAGSGEGEIAPPLPGM
jgi:hypothetical protein